MKFLLRGPCAWLVGLLILPLMAQAQLRWQEGVHYKLLPQPAPTAVPAGKIEVAEAFSYGCIYCFRNLSMIRQLAAELPSDAVMTYVHASFNPGEAWPMFQRAFYTAQALGVAASTHDQLFSAIWETSEFPLRDPSTGGIKQPLPTIEDAAAFYQKYSGVSAARFLELARSKQIDDAVRNADRLVALYRVPGTPSIIVNGRYLVMNQTMSSSAEARQLVGFLIGQERRRLRLAAPAPSSAPTPQ